MAKHIKTVIKKTLETLASEPLQKSPETPSLQKSPETTPRTERSMPLRNRWQQKWFDLEVTNPEIQRMADAAQKFVDMWYQRLDGKKLLVLFGDSGCGKTQVARGIFNIARHLMSDAMDKGFWTRPPSVQFVSWPKIVASMEAKETNSFFVREDLEESDLLILDDIGAEVDRYRTGSATETLREILGQRSRKWTVITTNIASEHWVESFDQRVADRLIRNSIPINLVGVGSYWANK